MRDAGYTRADATAVKYCCLFFARGCCPYGCVLISTCRGVIYLKTSRLTLQTRMRLPSSSTVTFPYVQERRTSWSTNATQINYRITRETALAAKSTQSIGTTWEELVRLTGRTGHCTLARSTRVQIRSRRTRRCFGISVNGARLPSVGWSPGS
jgi:hypothetical protein